MRPELSQFAEEVTRLTPPGTVIVDAHTHLGVDEDGHRLHSETLVRHLDDAGVARACVFALHDPDREPAYRVPNDRVLDWAAQSNDRLIPFCRLDPASDPAREAERCLARGARGIKLHPRAQSFGFHDGAADDIFRVAADAQVPILIHAGRGLPPIAESLCDVALRFPEAPLVLAHAAIADQAVFTTRLADHPAVAYDTSVMSPVDLLELYARVSPERIVYGTDMPYSRPLLGLYLTLRCAAAAGVGDVGRRALLGGTIDQLLSGTPLPVLSPPSVSRTMTVHGSLRRLHVYLSTAFAASRRGDRAGAREAVELAQGVCRDPDAGSAALVLERAAAALAAIAQTLDSGAERLPNDVLYLTLILVTTEPIHS